MGSADRVGISDCLSLLRRAQGPSPAPHRPSPADRTRCLRRDFAKGIRPPLVRPHRRFAPRCTPERKPSRASSVKESSAAKRPVLPQGFLETDHHVFWIQTRALRQAAKDVGQDLLLHFDAAAHRKEYFNQDEILCAASAEI